MIRSDYTTIDRSFPSVKRINEQGHADEKNDRNGKRQKSAPYDLGEDALGREEFYKIIRDYVKQYAFKNADQTDFFKVLYEYAGTDNKKLNSVTYRYLDDIGQPPAA